MNVATVIKQSELISFHLDFSNMLRVSTLAVLSAFAM